MENEAKQMLISICVMETLTGLQFEALQFTIGHPGLDFRILTFQIISRCKSLQWISRWSSILRTLDGSFLAQSEIQFGIPVLLFKQIFRCILKAQRPGKKILYDCVTPIWLSNYTSFELTQRATTPIIHLPFT